MSDLFDIAEESTVTMTLQWIHHSIPDHILATSANAYSVDKHVENLGKRALSNLVGACSKNLEAMWISGMLYNDNAKGDQAQ